jgi:hypothetical protein
MRGMDYEGIYRKSGGTTQMRQIQDEFERGDDVQFSPDLDICSVTSVLKQYLRNLPNPLITFEVYDRFIETSSECTSGPRCFGLSLLTCALSRHIRRGQTRGSPQGDHRRPAAGAP